MNNNSKVVIVGGVAAGPKTAARIKRLRPDADITIVEKGKFLSYAGCGLPYYISGVVEEQDESMATPVGVVRDVAFFDKVKQIRVLNETEALEIDREGKRLKVAGKDGESWLPYDYLVMATGAEPVVPPLPGVELEGIYPLKSVEDAERFKSVLAGSGIRRAVVIGGGLIGVEMVETLVELGREVTLIEMLPQILPMLDWEMARFVENQLKAKGITVLTGTRVEAFLGNGHVEKVKAGSQEIEADLVVMAIGVRPQVGLARDAGLQLGETGAIHVDAGMRTSDDHIYAVGDCVECRDVQTHEACYVPLGSTANKQGRVAANHICGHADAFPGVLGSTVCKVLNVNVARTGLTEAAARAKGFAVTTCLVPGPDKAHYYPANQMIAIKLVVDAATRVLLGVQVVGPGDVSKRVDVAATAITASMTVDQIAHLDLSYAPPFSPAMDGLITAANVARNKLDGLLKGISPMQVKLELDAGKKITLLDVRSPKEFEEVRIPGSINIPLGALPARMGSFPKDSEIATFCKISLRGYEAARKLEASGFENVRVMEGGIAMWPYEKETG